MRIFILGSNNGLNEDECINFAKFCRNLGKELARHRIEIILCSPYRDSADRNILSGLNNEDNLYLRIELHYPKYTKIESEWQNVIAEEMLSLDMFTHMMHPYEPELEEGIRFSWLYSQIQALNNSDIVIVIGGKIDGTANLLLRIAEGQKKDIIPIRLFGGLALQVFYRNYYKLIDIWGNELHLLEEQDAQSLLVDNILFHKSSKLKPLPKNPVFFLSYPRARPQEADFIEMQLRRRGLTVIRDDNDINESIDISNAIQESINKADVFIALWCKEYACSPWCFDELTTAVRKKQKDEYSIWLLCLDETRIVHPEARQLLYFRVTTREEVQGRVSTLLDKLLN